MKPPQFELQDALLAARIDRCKSLPSPPGVAAKIVELAQDPEVSMNEIGELVQIDPALSAKILRLANSPMYGMRRSIDNMNQAIAVLGLNETVTLALSFSLVKGLHWNGVNGLDYRHFWRRSLACATGARTLAKTLRLPDPDRFFLAGLLQDIGMLLVERVFPSVYRRQDAETHDHHEITQIEQSELGVDHARIGAALLRRWNFPEHLLYATYCSHEPDSYTVPVAYQPLIRGVYLASLMAEVWWQPDWDVQVSLATAEAERLFHIQPSAFAEMLVSGMAILKESSAIFDINLGDHAALEELLAEATELVNNRALDSMRQVVELRERTKDLARHTRRLEDLVRRDKQTGLFNRAYCDKMLDDEYDLALSSGTPLSVVFVGFDGLTDAKAAGGTQSVEDIMRKFAQLTAKVCAEDTVVARYGSNNVVILLANTPAPAARQRCLGVVDEFRRGPFFSTTGARIGMSIGIATVERIGQFASSRDLLAAADAAVETARDRGELMIEMHGVAANAQRGGTRTLQ